MLEDSLWLRVQDTGYEIALHPNQLARLLPESETELYCHMMVSDSDIKLYGFLKKAELLLFRRLLTVSGVGGKVAQAMVGSMAPEALTAAILSGDEKTLMKIPGVGKKMAQRLIFELRDKLGEGTLPLAAAENPAAAAGKMMGEIVEAMEALGYTRSEVYPLLVNLQEENRLLPRTAENIPLVLKLLADKKRR